MKRASLLFFCAALALTFGVLSQYEVRADGKKTEAKEGEKPELGQDWKRLRDGLNTVFRQLQDEAGIKPSSTCDDDTFLRRVYLDLVGRPPLPEEIETFRPGSSRDVHGNKGAAKRSAIVDQLLDSPEHAEHFAQWWTTIAIGRRADNNSKRFLRAYLVEAFAENRPWSKIVYDLVAAQGRTPENPEVGYLMSFQNRKADMAGITSKVFLGKQIQCAECHDHPYEDITESDFEGMEAFFRLTRTGARGRGAERYWYTNDKQVHNKHDASAKVRLKGDYLFPTYLGRETWEFESKDKILRESLAEWMTSPDNTWFREMSVNRYMAYFLGNGFVTPVDDFNAMNQPTFPVVLEQMGRDFAASGYDTRYLIRAIVNSELYQRETDTTRSNRTDFIHYSRAFVRKLTPEQIERSVMHVVGIERLNPHDPVRDVPDDKLTDDEKKNKRIRDGVRNYKRYLGRMMTEAYGSEPETRPLGDYDGTIVQALMFLNADLLGPGHLRNSLDEILEKYDSKSDRVRAIFETVLGRRPDKRDSAILNGTVMRWTGENNADYEDLFVALMNTTEFVTNH